VREHLATHDIALLRPTIDKRVRVWEPCRTRPGDVCLHQPVTERLRYARVVAPQIPVLPSFPGRPEVRLAALRVGCGEIRAGPSVRRAPWTGPGFSMLRGPAVNTGRLPEAYLSKTTIHLGSGDPNRIRPGRGGQMPSPPQLDL
jgi:hypothetical protein